ncbi:MAG: hypothetical protein K0R26_913 [Bacteroidota bacterium]|jgi:outer membrane protein OmpA-like peptidoglycan-associated protein/tetratricopeptide (TPR) repeat protein|nr:hypothetical protein [Bacteroidota bacterium]
MMFRAIFSFTLVFHGCVAISQILTPETAQELFNKKYYGAVWKFYHKQLQKDSLNADLNYKMGICYLNSRSQKEKSIPYLRKALTISDINSVQQAKTIKLLGDASYITEDYEKAIGYYESYQKLSMQNPGFALSDLSREIEMCRMATELKELKAITQQLVKQKSQTKKIKASHGLEKIGYSVSNTSPVFVKNELSLKEKIHDAYFEVQNFSIPTQTATTIPTDTSSTKMESTVASSTDGQIILIYRDEEGEADLYTSVLRGNEWATPERMSKMISNIYWEPDEYVSSDGKALYFASKRDGGFGGKDLYKSEKLENGEWGKAVNLGPTVNTMFDEQAPFIFPNGKTLHFSSNRNRPKGGFDHFTSSLTDSLQWTKPLNVGYPMNENSKELSTDTNSVRENYIATFINQKNIPINIIKGRLINSTGSDLPSDVEIIITNNETGEVAGIYRPDTQTGKYACIIPSWSNLNLTILAKGYLIRTENISIPKEGGLYKLQRPIVLRPLAPEQTSEINNIFFDPQKATIKPVSQIELTRLYSFLKEHSQQHFEISATLPRKTPSDEMKIAEERLQSVIQYLTQHGIDPSNLNAKVYKASKKKQQGAELASSENANHPITLKMTEKKNKR